MSDSERMRNSGAITRVLIILAVLAGFAIASSFLICPWSPFCRKEASLKEGNTVLQKPEPSPVNKPVVTKPKRHRQKAVVTQDHNDRETKTKLKASENVKKIEQPAKTIKKEKKDFEDEPVSNVISW